MSPAGVVNFYLIYTDDSPRALVSGRDEANAVENFRISTLGHPGPKPATTTAKLALDAPFEDFVRTALLGLYGVMLQAGMQQVATQRPGGR